MTQRMQVYKCMVCGNIVLVLHPSDGELVCCGEPMTLMKENSVDAAKEKHVPVLERIANGFKVSVGSVPHPMEEKHYIEWIELSDSDGNIFRKFLSPGDTPEACFETSAENAFARAYCNLHGLWKGEYPND